MKIIITEDQADTVKRIKVMEKFIDTILSEYDWYEGIDKVSVDTFTFEPPSWGFNTKYSVPYYIFYVNVNELPFGNDSKIIGKEEQKIDDEISEMFTSLFPMKNNKYTAVWVIRYRYPIPKNYGK